MWSVAGVPGGPSPQWSPGLMAGGSAQAMTMKDGDDVAAMEPRPDGRGKADLHPTAPPYETWPQWSPGLMAGGS